MLGETEHAVNRRAGEIVNLLLRPAAIHEARLQSVELEGFEDQPMGPQKLMITGGMARLLRTVRPPLYTALAPGTERIAAEIKPPAACHCEQGVSH